MAEQKRKEGVRVVIKEEQKNWRGWELRLLCTNWGGGRPGVVFSLSWSLLFSLFPLYFPWSEKNKSDFLPLSLLLWCLIGGNTGICFLPSLRCPLPRSPKLWIPPKLVGKSKPKPRRWWIELPVNNTAVISCLTGKTSVTWEISWIHNHIQYFCWSWWND